MSKIKPDAAQGPDQIIGDARKPYMLHALLVMNLRRYGITFLCDDEEGHALAVAVCSLGLRKKKWDSVMPWLRLMPKAEREAFDLRIARLEATPRNIATAARFTKADREKYGKEEELVGNKTKRPMQALLQLPLIDGDLEAERRKDRNEARRTRREDAPVVAKRARVARHRQCDRAYQRAKRRAEGATSREASVEALRPWEAEGISRRTWWRRRKAVAQVRRLQDGTGSSTAGLSPKPLQHRHYPVNADGPQPKISKRRARTIATSVLCSETAGPFKVASATPSESNRHDRTRGKGMTVKQNAKVQMMLRLLRQEIAEREAALTDAQDRPDHGHRSNALTKRTVGKFKMRSMASFDRELRQLRLRVTALDQRAKLLIGDAAFAAFENDLARIEQDADTSNVVRLRRYRSNQ